MHHWERRELPLVEVMMLVPYGSTSDPRERAGLTSLTTAMLDQGAGERDIYLYDRETARLLPIPGLNAPQEDLDPCVVPLPM